MRYSVIEIFDMIARLETAIDQSRLHRHSLAAVAEDLRRIADECEESAALMRATRGIPEVSRLQRFRQHSASPPSGPGD